ncbi:MAG TPA: methyltransferase domain-containing protein [Prolixibacteraceae bacterium]|nr:methyltransferase domain-containing protein [Prolixibacteraceae bacterium]
MKNIFINIFYYWIGIGFLMLSRIKSFIQGYSAPKPFSITEFQRCVAYDIGIVDQWIAKLNEYVKDDKKSTLNNKVILELGPGSDLGVGLYLLSKSIKQYIAIDVNNLIKDVPEQFYNVFFTYLKDKHQLDVSFLIEELDKTRNGHNDKLDYIYRKDFDIVSAVGSRKMDLIFSHASFEHFDDVNETIKQVSTVANPGAIIMGLVDLKTHSRWIRDKDPNNIYRYSERIYRLFSSSGTPNRFRPYQYKLAFEKYGWKNILIIPGRILEEVKLNFIKKHLDRKFREDKNQMDYLEMWLYATKT